MEQLVSKLDAIAALTREMADNEYSLANDRRAARVHYLIRLYELTTPKLGAGLTDVYDRLCDFRLTLPPRDPQLNALEHLTLNCREVLSISDNFNLTLLPRHMDEVDQNLDRPTALPRSVTYGFVSALEILIKNIRKYYCSNEPDVL